MNIRKNIHKTTLAALTISAALAYAPVSSAALSYSQNWEAPYTPPAGQVGDGFVIGNIDATTGGQWFAGQPAPTGVNAWSDFVDEGGLAQGDVQLSIYTDYNNSALNNGNNVTSFVYKDLGTITNDMVGNTYSFSFDAKLGNILTGPNGAGDANAYMTILDGSSNTLFNDTFNYTGLPGDSSWGGGSIDVLILPAFDGQLLQIGFSTETTGFQDTGIIYDNLSFAPTAVPVPAAVWLFGSGLLGLVGVARRRKQA